MVSYDQSHEQPLMSNQLHKHVFSWVDSIFSVPFTAVSCDALTPFIWWQKRHVMCRILCQLSPKVLFWNKMQQEKLRFACKTSVKTICVRATSWALCRLLCVTCRRLWRSSRETWWRWSVLWSKPRLTWALSAQSRKSLILSRCRRCSLRYHLHNCCRYVEQRFFTISYSVNYCIFVFSLKFFQSHSKSKFAYIYSAT